MTLHPKCTIANKILDVGPEVNIHYIVSVLGCLYLHSKDVNVIGHKKIHISDIYNNVLIIRNIRMTKVLGVLEKKIILLMLLNLMNTM